MGPLSRIILAVMAALIAGPVPAAPIDRFKSEIALASKRFGIPQSWIVEVMDAESGGRTSLFGMPIVSAAGAMGLMQLMPGTWEEMRGAHALGTDPFDPRDNILAGAAYLRSMYDRFGYPGLFAAYNAGPNRYARFLAGADLPAETIRYATQITGRVEKRAALSDSRHRRSRALKAQRGFSAIFAIAAEPSASLRTRGSKAREPILAIGN